MAYPCSIGPYSLCQKPMPKHVFFFILLHGNQYSPSSNCKNSHLSSCFLYFVHLRQNVTIMKNVLLIPANSRMESEEIEGEKPSKPTCLIVMGMAGSGKTTFVQRLTASLNLADQERPPYVINLDPAVLELQFPVSSNR